MAKTLIAYFSRTDENYNVGFINEGNTAKVAKQIKAVLQEKGVESDMFEITPAVKYSRGYNECIAKAKTELQAKARPKITGTIDVSGYDTIYLGYPNWWGDLPMCVYTFLESGDFSGKTIVPFCTHEGSGLGSTEGKLKKSLPASKFESGLAIQGIVAQNDEERTKRLVKGWL